MIEVVCGSCWSKAKVKDEHAGKRVKCPACGSPVAVPVPAPVPAAAPIAAGLALSPAPAAAPAPPPAAGPAPGVAYSPFEAGVLWKMDQQIALLKNISWHVSGIWWFLWGPVIVAMIIAAVAVLAALGSRGQ